MSREHRPLDLGAVHGGARRARQRRNRPDVVEVAVGYQDRLDLDPQRIDRLQQARGLVSGVDDHRARDVAAGADDVRVLLHRADGERPHVQPAHRDAALPPALLAFLRWRRS